MAQLEAIYRQSAGQRDYTPSSATTAGTVIQLDSGLTAICKTDLAASQQGAVYTRGIFDVACATGVTFSAGQPVYWDASADTAITEASAEPGDYYCGLCTVTKTTELVVRVDLNALAAMPGRVFQSRVYEFDCDSTSGSGTTAITLVPAVWNKTGLIVLAAYGLVTEVFNGTTEDQGIVTIEDSDATAICTLTVSDTHADSTGDVIVGTVTPIGASTGAAVVTVAAGKSIAGRVTQQTSGTSHAGKMKIRLICAPLV